MSFCGLTNAATWSVLLWMENERRYAAVVDRLRANKARQDRIVRDEATQHARQHPAAPAVDLDAAEANRWAYNVMTAVQSLMGRQTPDGHKLSEVNWSEVARHLIEE